MFDVFLCIIFCKENTPKVSITLDLCQVKSVKNKILVQSLKAVPHLRTQSARARAVHSSRLEIAVKYIFITLLFLKCTRTVLFVFAEDIIA